MNDEVCYPPPDASTIPGTSSVLSALLRLILRVSLAIANQALVVLPGKIVQVLLKQLSIRMSLLLLVLTLAVAMSVMYYLVRQRHLRKYSEETTPKSNKLDHTKTNGQIDYLAARKAKGGRDTQPNYLDEFLQAIKVFGYLERPVFHELTKNMTTQKIGGDEILCLDESLGFSIVVEGVVQVFTKAQEPAEIGGMRPRNDYESGEFIDVRNQRYQLLNEVKSGAPLSSLLSTLDLFRSKSRQSAPDRISPDFKLDKNGPKGDFRSERGGREDFKGEWARTDRGDRIERGVNTDFRSDKAAKSGVYLNSMDLHDLPKLRGPEHSGKNGTESKLNTPIEIDPFSRSFLHNTPSISSPFPEWPESRAMLEEPVDELPLIIAKPKPGHKQKSGVLNTATIAIIPALAFQRVYAKYPKATSHIVTMVLARLYKVTQNAVHNYFGLTREIIQSEITLNTEAPLCKLPSYLSESVLENLWALYTPGLGQSQYAINVLEKSTKKPRKLHRESSSRYVVLALRLKLSHPGDLLSSVPLSRKSNLSQKSLRDAVDALSRPLPMSRAGSSVKIKTAGAAASDRRPFAGVDMLGALDTRNFSGDMPGNAGQHFSDEREETEETSLRTAIAENLFKLLGIEDHFDRPTYEGFLSGTSSASSSRIGLNYLADPQISERYFYNSILDSASGYLSPHPQKVYPTIHTEKTQSDGHPKAEPNRSKIDYSLAAAKSSFSKNVEVKYFTSGSTLVEQDSFETGLYYVIHGTLNVTTRRDPKEEVSPESEARSNDKSGRNTNHLYTVSSGGVAGYLSSLVGFKSLVSIVAGETSDSEGAIVAYVSKEDFSRFMDKFYFLQLPVAAKLKSLMPELIKIIDFALEWCHIPAGGILASQGDWANGFHIVLSGRFRVVRNNQLKMQAANHCLVDDLNENKKSDKEDEYEVLGEYGPGQSIGEAEVLTASRRTNLLIAVRDSETARIPRTLFEMLSLQNPSIMVKVSRIVANRVMESNSREVLLHASVGSLIQHGSEINKDYKTITILPTVGGLPVKEFAEQLLHALKAIGRDVIALDRTSTLTHLGRHAFDERLSHLKLSGYFAYLEEKYETILYVCDTPLRSSWTSTCISQGDCILLLADAEDDECATNIGDYERLLVKLRTTARTDLCLLHAEKSVMPGSTSIWLKNRMWIQDHHHIQMAISRDTLVKRHNEKKKNILFDLALKLSSKANPNIKLKLENVTSRAMASLIKLNERVNKRPDTLPVAHKNDFMRLARILSNEAVGLVLGGGGSRGISHVGVVTALEKHGIPVDIIGGTSIGSFVGGLYAKENNIVSIYGMTKKFSSRVGSIWRNIFDLTYPVTSYITGYEFNRGIWKVFGYSEIEDFWIKYFCNSTNITNSNMEIHESGYAWRFIRASMSLAGLLPPIAFNGCMLLDGGYLDNLPVSEMKNRGAKYIIAVDVGSVDDRTPMTYGDTLSGFWVLFNRINPFSKHPNVPNMMDIQLRLAYVASVYALEVAKKTPGVIYLRPPIDDYATLDFLKFDEIYNVGLAYADQVLTKWQRKGQFPKIAGMSKTGHKDSSRKITYRRNSI